LGSQCKNTIGKTIWGKTIKDLLIAQRDKSLLCWVDQNNNVKIVKTIRVKIIEVKIIKDKAVEDKVNLSVILLLMILTPIILTQVILISLSLYNLDACRSFLGTPLIAAPARSSYIFPVVRNKITFVSFRVFRGLTQGKVTGWIARYLFLRIVTWQNHSKWRSNSWTFYISRSALSFSFSVGDWWLIATGCRNNRRRK
jgi:hypothetical protein